MKSNRLRRAVAILAAMIVSPVAREANGEEPAPPRPVAVWAAGPLDVTLAFPRPVDLAVILPQGIKTISYYAEGMADSDRPLGSLRCEGVRTSDDGRVLTLATDPHPVAARYVLELGGGIVAYDLGGVEIAWFEGDEPADEPSWKGWLPSLDPLASQAATSGSAPHARWFADMARVGQLRLETQARLPAGTNRLTIESTAPIVECFSGEGEPENGVEGTESGGGRGVFAVADPSAPLFLSLTIKTGAGKSPPSIKARFASKDGGESGELTRGQLVLPWVALSPPSAEAPAPAPDLSGGDPARGKAIFFSDEALCSRCHAVGGEGGTVGPDLSDLREKSPADLYRSIAAPSDQIAPEYIPYTVSLKDGRIVAGVARASGVDALRVIDSDAKETVIPRDEIDEIRPGSTSIMPVGLLPALGDARVRDLIAFLKSREAGGQAP